MDTKAVEFVAPGVVRVIDVDVPKQGRGQCVVRTLFSGISAGTETMAFNGLIDPSTELDESIDSMEGTFAFPFRYGYSCVGIVERGAGSIAAGQQVFCLHPHQGVLVRPADEFVVVDGIAPRVATMLPLVETGLQIALDAGPQDGPVIVFGLGAIGILAGAAMARSGTQVIGVEPLDYRREGAATFGIEAVAPDEVPADVPMIVDCTGSPEVLASGLGLLAHEGVALVASWYGEKPVELPLGGSFHRRRLTIRSTQVSSIPEALQDEWTFEKRTAAAVELMKELPVDVLATHTFPVAEAQRAFEAADKAEDGLIHAALAYE